MDGKLPAELIQLICEELEEQRDYRTLYRCALSSKTFAGHALKSVYRYALF